MKPPSDSSPRDVPDDWSVDLDPDSPPAMEPAQPVRLGRWIAAGLVVAVVAASAMIWGPDVDTGEDPPPVAAVLGAHLAVPIALHLPADAVATADGSYLGVQFPAGGVVLVTVPTQVVNPSGARMPLPTDPAAWLSGHPSVFVSRVRDVKVGGAPATQLDYRRSRMAAPRSQFARLPLFCGWRNEAGSSSQLDPAPPVLPDSAADSAQAPSEICTRITDDARVRATFIHIGDRTVLVEAVWRVGEGGPGTGRMPRNLQRSYASLLAGLIPHG